MVYGHAMAILMQRWGFKSPMDDMGLKLQSPINEING
jgi:hypothetical protein